MRLITPLKVHLRGHADRKHRCRSGLCTQYQSTLRIERTVLGFFRVSAEHSIDGKLQDEMQR